MDGQRRRLHWFFALHVLDVHHQWNLQNGGRERWKIPLHKGQAPKDATRVHLVFFVLRIGR